LQVYSSLAQTLPPATLTYDGSQDVSGATKLNAT